MGRVNFARSNPQIAERDRLFDDLLFVGREAGQRNAFVDEEPHRANVALKQQVSLLGNARVVVFAIERKDAARPTARAPGIIKETVAITRREIHRQIGGDFVVQLVGDTVG